MALAQQAYRFGGNDGTESTHSFLAALNTPIIRAPSDASTFLLRILMQETAGVAHSNLAVQWQYRKNGAAAVNITTTSANIKAVTTTVYAAESNPTSRLGGTGTFETSSATATHDGATGGANCDIVANGRAETVCALQLVPADLVEGDVIEILIAGLTTYPVLPIILVTASPAFVPNSVVFDGTNDYVELLSAYAGAAASGMFTLAAMVRFTGAGADQHIITNAIGTAGGDFRFIFARNTDDTMYLVARNAAGTNILDLDSGTVLTVDTWYAVLLSVNLANTSQRHLYISQVGSGDSLDSTTWVTYTNDTINFAATRNRVGASSTTAGQKFNGQLSEVWFDPGRYVDLSVAANRRLFFTSGNYPVSKGDFGETPFSARPQVFLTGPTGSWQANHGTGGGFGLVGALTDGTAIPAPGAGLAFAPPMRRFQHMLVR